MIRTFVGERNTGWDELIQINTENEQVKIYLVDKELGFPFSEHHTTISRMGYKSVNEIIDRIISFLKEKELDTDRQIAREITGLLKLAKYRVDHGIDTGNNDIVQRLRAYGMTYAGAAKKVDYFINHGIEQHNVKVVFENGDTITTAINGTIEEIENPS